MRKMISTCFLSFVFFLLGCYEGRQEYHGFTASNLRSMQHEHFHKHNDNHRMYLVKVHALLDSGEKTRECLSRIINDLPEEFYLLEMIDQYDHYSAYIRVYPQERYLLDPNECTYKRIGPVDINASINQMKRNEINPSYGMIQSISILTKISSKEGIRVIGLLGS